MCNIKVQFRWLHYFIFYLSIRPSTFLSFHFIHVNHCMFFVRVDWDKNFPKWKEMGEIEGNKILCYWWEGHFSYRGDVYWRAAEVKTTITTLLWNLSGRSEFEKTTPPNTNEAWLTKTNFQGKEMLLWQKKLHISTNQTLISLEYTKIFGT